MQTFGIALTASQERAIRRLVHCLEDAAICYQFTGGFAANLHGSRWPLHDIDLEVAERDLPRLAEILAPCITRPLGLYEDEEFRLYLFCATLDGMEIEVNQAECAYVRCGGQWVPLQTDLAHRQKVKLFDLHVWVQPLQALIEYKALLGRDADLADLQSLQRRCGRPL